MKQMSLGNTRFELSNKRTRKREFLDEVDCVVPWGELVGLIAPHAPARLIDDMSITPGALLRQKGTPYDALGLYRPTSTDAQLIDFMAQEPIHINRPIVVTPLGTRQCRPSEAVLDLLPAPRQGVFTKEDGETVIGAKGARIAKP